MQWTDTDMCENMLSKKWVMGENCNYFHQADNI